MASKQERNVAAVIPEKGAQITITTRDIPQPGSDEIVVRNHAIAVNPVDWKIQAYGFMVNNYPNVLGSDDCGIVTAVGSGVTKFKVGDRVTGFAGVIYNQNPDHGAFQTYGILREIAATKIPDSMSFEEGATFPMAFATSAVALFAQLKVARPGTSVESHGKGILIWGAASSVGTAAIQLARNAGLKVFATASPTHHDYLKSLGAFDVFDYKDADVISKIAASAKAAGTPISLGFDTISEGSTFTQSTGVIIASAGKGKLCLTLPWSAKEPAPDTVAIVETGAYRTGTDLTDLGSWLFNEYLPKELENKGIVAATKIEIVSGGIAASQAAFDQLKAGVSGKKLVLKID